MKLLRHSILAAALLALASLCAGAQTTVPRRIISVSPNVTEMLYGVGAFGRVIAVSDFCTFPPEVKELPRVGGWQNPSIERIAALRPDLVILTDAQAPFIVDKLQQLALRSLIVQTLSLQDIFTAIEEIGRATGSERQAAELVRHTRATLDAVRGRSRNLPRRSVLFVVDRTPGTLRDLYIATEGSFLAELIEIAGGKAIAAPAKGGYGKIGKEAVLTLNPEVIIDMVQGASGRLAENPQQVWNDLPELKAVREGRVYPVRDEFTPHASQFVAQTVERLASMIHPESFHGAKK